MKWLRRMADNILWIGGPSLRNPTPVTVCRFLTFYGWGLDCRLPGTILVWSWRGDRGVYLSKDGTPGRATWWLRLPRWRRG